MSGFLLKSCFRFVGKIGFLEKVGNNYFTQFWKPVLETHFKTSTRKKAYGKVWLHGPGDTSRCLIIYPPCRFDKFQINKYKYYYLLQLSEKATVCRYSKEVLWNYWSKNLPWI